MILRIKIIGKINFVISIILNISLIMRSKHTKEIFVMIFIDEINKLNGDHLWA